MRKTFFFLHLVLLLVLTSCYHQKSPSRFHLSDSIQEAQISRHLQARGDSLSKTDTAANWYNTTSPIDSFAFRVRHHYSQGFNFIVTSDSLMLFRQQPEEVVNGMPTDSFAVRNGKSLVVADIRIIPADKTDSVWVQIATENNTFGWVHETNLLKKVDPDDPISQFISMFSNRHLIIFLVVILLIAVGYLARKILRQNAHIVHFNDINSFYPTALAILVAISATFYASIQLFASETWREFYFHPSLNPFSQPLLLNIFLILVWSMLITALATIDDVRRRLGSADTLLYLCGLTAVCAINYIVFSILTLYYVGYFLLLVYIIFALRTFFRNGVEIYICGNCSARLRRKGRCPKCGVMNE